MPTDQADILFASQALLRRLKPGDLDATLDNITRAAVEVLPEVQYASISMRHPDGTLHSYASTDRLLADLDQQQSQLQEGPCYDVASNDVYLVFSNLGADDRYPHQGPIAVRAGAGIRSQAAIKLFEDRKTAGGLNLQSRQVSALAEMETLSRLFSHQAAIALPYSFEIRTLREAVRSRTRIGQAVGVVMERYKIPEQQALGFLTRLSQTRNIKLRDIADQLMKPSAQDE